MPISINTKALYKILEKTPASHNIMLCGKHGIGKSQILTDYFSSKGIPVVTLFLGQMSDPGDLIGLPKIDESSKKTEFLPPQWFPLDNKPICLFLDELNRARPEILQAVMDLSLNRKLAGRNLPEGSFIISAVNSGEDYQVTDLDPALISCFNIYTFEPAPVEWIEWGSKNGIDERILKFIKDHPKYLDSIKNTTDDNLEKTPDRRAWARVSDLISGEDKIDSMLKKLIAGIIGKSTTAKFIESLSFVDSYSATDVLYHFDKIEQRIKLLFSTQLAIINEDIYTFLQASSYKQTEIQTIASNLVKYSNMLKEPSKKESFAHFVSFFTESKYPTANQFIMINTNQIFQQILAFGRSI